LKKIVSEKESIQEITAAASRKKAITGVFCAAAQEKTVEGQTVARMVLRAVII
jgi:hypothetical protein